MDEEGSLPEDITALEMIQHLEIKVKDNAISGRNFKTIRQNFYNRTYVPNSNGMEEYFRECETDRRTIQQLGFKPIPYDEIMVLAKDALFNSGHYQQNESTRT